MEKECCKHNKNVDPTANFCPTCGEQLKENADPKNNPAKYQCEACCRAVAYRTISYGDDAVKNCPNCGEKVEKGTLRDPGGYMACCF